MESAAAANKLLHSNSLSPPNTLVSNGRESPDSAIYSLNGTSCASMDPVSGKATSQVNSHHATETNALGVDIGEDLDPLVYLGQGKPRPIEDELANRILSDISEEGSIGSDHEDDHQPRRRFGSKERMLSADLDTITDLTVTDGERTPTQDDYESDQNSIKLRPGAAAAAAAAPAQLITMATQNLVGSPQAPPLTNGQPRTPPQELNLNLLKTCSDMPNDASGLYHNNSNVNKYNSTSTAPSLELSLSTHQLLIEPNRPLSIQTKGLLLHSPSGSSDLLSSPSSQRSPRSPRERREVELIAIVKSRTPSGDRRSGGVRSPFLASPVSPAGGDEDLSPVPNSHDAPAGWGAKPKTVPPSSNNSNSNAPTGAGQDNASTSQTGKPSGGRTGPDPVIKRLNDEFEGLQAEVQRIKEECSRRKEAIADIRRRPLPNYEDYDSVGNRGTSGTDHDTGFSRYRPLSNGPGAGDRFSRDISDDSRGGRNRAPRAEIPMESRNHDYAPGEAEWDSDYQTGPETYLLQTRDPDLAARIRDYRRQLFGGENSVDYYIKGVVHGLGKDVTIRERRRYRDMVKTDADLQRTEAGLSRDLSLHNIETIRRAAPREAASAVNLQTLLINEDGTHPPVFKCRLKELAFMEEGSITFQCVIVGNPIPVVTWYRNDALIEEGPRHKFGFRHTRATLKISPAYATDAGFYKCKAVNELGEAYSSARLRMGDVPLKPERPDVELASDTEVFLSWKPPPSNTIEIQGYKLEYRRPMADNWSGPWLSISANVDEECAVIRHLEPLGIYQFRVIAKNCFGWGEPSLATRMIQTHQRGATKLNIEILKEQRRLNVVTMPQSGLLVEIPEEQDADEVSTASEDITENSQQLSASSSMELNMSENPSSRYQLESEIFRGRFCLVRNAVDKKSESAAHCIAKVLIASDELKAQAINEFQVLRGVQHEHIVVLLNAYLRDDFLVLFTEKLDEELLSRFTYKDFYTEDHVARVVAQLLSAVQWIHFKKIAYLDLQPDNVMFANKRGWLVKLVDMGSAVMLSPGQETKVDVFCEEYSAPEVLNRQPISLTTDVWGIGLLTFILLSGFHPFATDFEPKDVVTKNIQEGRLDLKYAYANVSEEALKFLAWALKKPQLNRMSTEEGLRHSWLQLSDVKVRRRESLRFSANRLRAFARQYKQKLLCAATTHTQLIAAYGGGGAGGGVRVSP